MTGAVRNAPGSLVWFELLTRDADAAQAFYADVLGWTVSPGQSPGIDYRPFTAADGDPVGAIMQPPADHAGPVTWRGYVEVVDVDGSVDRIVAAGGAVHLPPMDIPSAGRIAMLADPQGATFYVIASAAGGSRAFLPSDRARPGHAVWADLAAPDPAAAIAFYTDQFGWRQQGAMSMGDAGDYAFLVHGDDAIGAIMPPVAGAEPGWRIFFHVADIDAAAARIRTAGGTDIQGPDPIPGDSWTVVARDPQGARFGLVGRRTTIASTGESAA